VTETKEISTGTKCTRYPVDTLDYGTAHVDARTCTRARASTRGWWTGMQEESEKEA